MLKKLQEELKHLEKIEYEIDKTIKEAPKGNLRCSTSRGCFQYYQGRKYLNKEKREFVKQLAQKEYCLSIKNDVLKLKKNMELLVKVYQEEAIERKYRDLVPARKAVIKPLFKPIEEIIKEFESIQYTGKEFAEDDTTEYYTSKGERVRSKSEKIIADELFRYGIPYKYEMPIELNAWNRKVIFYPDFTVLNKRTGKKKILEHLGMMDNEKYFENAINKIDIYEKNGYLLGDKLLIFHETAISPLNTKVMQNYIEHYLL